MGGEGEKNSNMGLDEDGIGGFYEIKVVNFSHSLHSWLPLSLNSAVSHIFPTTKPRNACTEHLNE